MKKEFDSLYFHSIRMDLETFERIIRSGHLLSLNRLGLPNRDYASYNGREWISLCKYCDMDDETLHEFGMRSAYNRLVVNNLSLVFTNLKRAKSTYYKPYGELRFHPVSDDDETRYSDCFDEYQVRDHVSLKHLVGILYPIASTKASDPITYKRELEIIKGILESYHYNVPVLDSSWGEIEHSLRKLEKTL